jgi:hypothetical protein
MKIRFTDEYFPNELMRHYTTYCSLLYLDTQYFDCYDQK